MMRHDLRYPPPAEARDAPHDGRATGPRPPTVAFGPEAPGWGSWDWVGADVAHELAHAFDTRTFPPWEVPDADLVLVVKHPPPLAWVDAVVRRARLIYCPVDRYGSAAEIDADAPWLRRCARVLVHAEPLRRYFEPYAPVEYIDHHVKFAAPLRDTFQPDGPVLWVGVHTNLPPLIAWVNAHPVPRTLEVMSNFEGPDGPPSPDALGFAATTSIRTLDWGPEAQRERTARASGFLDIKGDDFRARHKPPAKGIDAIASGVPLAMNADSGTVTHLARMGFKVCSPLETERWASEAYWDETRRFGAALRELLSRERIGLRTKRIVAEVLGAGHHALT